jgi:hypothetical protein
MAPLGRVPGMRGTVRFRLAQDGIAAGFAAW